jgi:hypothetical protein
MRNETREALELFVEKAKILRTLSFIECSEKLTFKWTWEKGKGEDLEIIGPNQEQIYAYILTFRYFIQNNEHCSFGWLAGHVLDDAQLSNIWKQEFIKIRTGLNQFLDSNHPVFPIAFQGECPATCREILETFIFGDISHVNKNKRDTFKKWMSLPKLAEGIFKVQFIQIIKALHSAIEAVADLTVVELKNQE